MKFLQNKRRKRRARLHLNNKKIVFILYCLRFALTLTVVQVTHVRKNQILFGFSLT